MQESPRGEQARLSEAASFSLSLFKREYGRQSAAANTLGLEAEAGQPTTAYTTRPLDVPNQSLLERMHLFQK